MKSIETPRLVVSSLTRLRTAPCTDTSKALVISSAMMTSGRAASARASAIRWRCPPERVPGIRVATDGSRWTRSSSSATAARCPRREGSASAMLAPTDIRGLRAPAGSWKTIWIGRRRPRVGAGRPSSRTCPEVTVSSPTAVRPRVDLPDPLSPTSPTTVPGGTVRLTWSTAVIAAAPRPNRTVTSANSRVLTTTPPQGRP